MPKNAGSLIIDLIGPELSSEEIELIAHPLVGGIILFSRNYVDVKQLTALCRSIRETKKTPLLIMVDQEGGRVQRFKDGFTQLPSLKQIGKNYKFRDKEHGAWIEDLAYLMAHELRMVGIDFSLCPVIDLDKEVNPALKDRVFHQEPSYVAQFSLHYMQGLKDAGMIAVAKHFPGHGSVKIDSHAELPYDGRNLMAIMKEDLIPFITLIENKVPALMAAHIIFTQIDDKPVGYSKIWLQEILRKQLKFEGAVFSDDINMEGAKISSNFVDRYDAAREAGCDFVLACNNRKGAIAILDQTSLQKNLLSLSSLLALKARDVPLNLSRWNKIKTNLNNQIKQ